MSTCERCKYLLRVANPKLLTAPALFCRRYPPQLLAVGGQVTCIFPPVTSETICGEYAVRENPHGGN